ncbi:DUF2946 domain-containing protein [Trinickia caryophylli]|uniref:DUF2946 domain-containing protein n=1 Tax=Trinickia caryophylli TaxID=28094 RepID=A0A1X7GL74_TRICW|nr:DUF2946 domain-containing protein [Trinickia caryophylli]WQE14855.1 DUF2946 domain-containing protein [Trinickia caryophylli]GLU35062.1 hypothetical protein Busp01_49040 [Trinickia caryophylli]SMF71319.1 Protein of unknown function [Trinickia caryophylli]
MTAWLGLIAMWLIVFVPIASQLVVAAQRSGPSAIAAAECSAAQLPGPGELGHASVSKPALAACGYCDLLCTHAAIAPVAAVTLAYLVLVVIAAAPVLSTHFTPLGAFPSGRPRAPPVVS